VGGSGRESNSSGGFGNDIFIFGTGEAASENISFFQVGEDALLLRDGLSIVGVSESQPGNQPITFVSIGQNDVSEDGIFLPGVSGVTDPNDLLF
jgi:hypothetical protein